ncbi:MAG: sigma-70 family RNA polymerase sigma factor [Myxococcota bacterium]
MGQPTQVESGRGEESERFAVIYEQHFDFVWRSARRLGVPSAAVDDAVQDVFLVVHRRLHEFEGRSKLKTWLFGITLNVAKAHRRKRGRIVDLLEAELVDPGPDPEATAEAEQARGLLHSCLDELDEDKRAVFVLAELEQATAPEIAEALQLKLNTVYSRLRAARRAFEAAVGRHRAAQERVEGEIA